MTAPTAASREKLVQSSTGIEYRDTADSATWRPSAVPRTDAEVARLNEIVGYEKCRAVTS